MTLVDFYRALEADSADWQLRMVLRDWAWEHDELEVEAAQEYLLEHRKHSRKNYGGEWLWGRDDNTNNWHEAELWAAAEVPKPLFDSLVTWRSPAGSTAVWWKAYETLLEAERDLGRALRANPH